MKIFERDGKINFVDVNNVFVGFDNRQDCCETFGYFFSYHEEIEIGETITLPGIEDYVFDPNYFVQVSKVDVRDSLDEGDMVRFKLTAPGKPDVFLQLYNVHNGYYGHGFESTIGGLKWESGVL